MISPYLIVKTDKVQTILVISSFVAASRVGASASAFCLRRLGHEAVILPTTLMGRHPGWGNPGGGAVDAERLADMWAAIKAQNIKFDAVLTGYMGQTAHIALTAQIITDIKSVNPDAYILVDPVMGDFTDNNLGSLYNGRLYIPEDRAQAICQTLLPLADMITPNLWELGYITGHRLNTAQDALRALQGLNQAAIVTSVPYTQNDTTSDNCTKEIGALLYDGVVASQSHHERFASVPHGGGDSLAGLYLGHYLRGDTPRMAMRKSVSALFQIMSLAQNMAQNSHYKNQINTTSLPICELPLIQGQDSLINSPPLDFIELKI